MNTSGVFEALRAKPPTVMRGTLAVLALGLLMACTESPVNVEANSMDGTDYFASTYEAARDAFLGAAQAAGAGVESLRHPHTGPGGDPLFMDVALLGSEDAKTILVLSSATHGVEGFAGSAIQTGLLREGVAACLDADQSIVMIHGLNPYGFAHLRRFTEDNVDLNRNFLDHSQPHPRNPGYEKLAGVFAPESVSWRSEIAFWTRVAWYRIRHGMDSLRQATTGGQYSHPEGLFYGGTSDAWSNRTLRSVAQRYLARAERVVVVDVHTGLGPYGRGEIILNDPEESPAYQRAAGTWGTARVRTTVTGASVSVHLPGSVKLAFARTLPSAEVTAVSLEFGTRPAMTVVRALRAENWLRHHGGADHPDAAQIRRDLLDAFYPETDDWKALVWEQGKEVVEQALGCEAPRAGGAEEAQAHR